MAFSAQKTAEKTLEFYVFNHHFKIEDEEEEEKEEEEDRRRNPTACVLHTNMLPRNDNLQPTCWTLEEAT